MSSPRESTVRCPHCGHEQRFQQWASLNVTLNPEEKEKLLSGVLFQCTCERCGKTQSVPYAMLYHDMREAVLIWAGPPDPAGLRALGLPPEMLATYRLRLVTNLNELIEKVRIFDAGLDDRYIEVFKVSLRMQLAAPEGDLLYFAESVTRDNGSTVLLFAWIGAKGEQTIECPRSSYDAVGRAVASRFSASTGDWLAVDRGYVVARLKGSGA